MLEDNIMDMTPKKCPNCKNPLDINPNVEGCLSCYYHGDYLLRNNEWVWSPLQSTIIL